jgi:preprotein translocase subunit SecE
VAEDVSKKAVADSSGGASTQSLGSGIPSFIQGTKEELAKVVWPTRQQLISQSAGVILMVALSAALIYAVDNLLHWAARLVFK